MYSKDDMGNLHDGILPYMKRNLTANAPFDKSVLDLDLKGFKRGIVIGSGPSLDLTWDTLSKAEGYKICCDGSIWDMLNHGLRPDAVITCELDSQEERPGRPSTELLLNHGPLDKYNGVPLICPTWANRFFLKKWPGDKFFYLNSDPQYESVVDRHAKDIPNKDKIPKVFSTAPMVGFHAVALCKVLGFEEVWTFGFDCTTVGEKHHSSAFPLNEWEVNLEKHFRRHRGRVKSHHEGKVGHDNVINHSPLSAIIPPDFKVRLPDE